MPLPAAMKAAVKEASHGSYDPCLIGGPRLGRARHDFSKLTRSESWAVGRLVCGDKDVADVAELERNSGRTVNPPAVVVPPSDVMVLMDGKWVVPDEAYLKEKGVTCV